MKKTKLNILIPMAGEGSRFKSAGYTEPKPFIQVLEKTLIEHVLDNLYVKNARYILIARSEHLISQKKIVHRIKRKFNVEFIKINKLTEGAVMTILHAYHLIDNKIPLLIANSDQIVDIDINLFINDSKKRNLDGSILTFVDKFKSNKWSFVKLNKFGLVKEVKEKQVISKYATSGIYYFSKGCYFVNSAIKMIINNDRVNGEFYTCPIYNYAVKNDLKIGTYNIKQSLMHGLGTPEDLNSYINLY
jgi:NDP-sugar pyrophosphorylase family protein